MKDKKQAPNSKVKVLYQYLNGRWYAFADVGNEEIFFGQVPLKAQAKSKSSDKGKTTKKSGKSRSSSKDA